MFPKAVASAMRRFVVGTLLGLLFVTNVAVAADPAELAVDQAALAARFERLEALALRIAELVQQDSPERAEQLRSAIRRSRELALAERFSSIVELLESERLSAADRDQQVLADQLGQLMQLLLADPRMAKAEAERRRLEALLKDVGRFIRDQQSLRDALFDGEAAERVAKQQGKLAEEVEQARRRAPGKEGQAGGKPQAGPTPPAGSSSQSQPSEQEAPSGSSSGEGGQPSGQQGREEQQPIERARQRLAQAQRSMQRAIEALEDSNNDKAEGDQSEALQRLEDARREIKQALRQLREEEQVRMLTRLATRFRRILAEQTEIYELTKSTAASATEPIDRATRLAAAGLSQREQGLVELADGAMRILQEDGKSVAFPETVRQLRGDMIQVAAWLGETRLGRGTQLLEEDIIEQLQAAISAFEQAAAEKQQLQQTPPGSTPGGSQAGPQLVDLIAELRMVRTLQVRLLRRTEMWDSMLSTGEVAPDAARESLRRLAENQARLVQAAESLDKSLRQQ